MTQQRVSPISVTSVLPALPVLSLQAALGQSANLTEWKNSSGTTLSFITPTGQVYTPQVFSQYYTNLTNTGGFLDTTTLTPAFYQRTASSVGMFVRGAASQTADLQQWQNSAGTALVKVAADGHLIVGSFNNSGWISVNPDGAARIPIRITLAASQTADSIRIDNSSNAALFRINNAGQIQPPLSASIGLVVKGLDSQTGDLQQWQDSSGAVVANISSDGNFQVYNRAATATNGSISVSGYYNGNYGILNLQANGFTAAELSGSRDGTKFWIRTYDGVSALQNFLKVEANRDATFYGNIIINSTVASSAGLMIKGASSQTANLQEWQNSAGTVLAKVDAYGYVISNGAVLPSGAGSFETAYGGAFMGMKKTTATVANPVANVARMYFVDGTTAGTLKLVVKAGASGAETTILDNIPQS